MMKSFVILAAVASLVLANPHTHSHIPIHTPTQTPTHTPTHTEESETGIAHLEGMYGKTLVSGDLIFTMQGEDKMLITGIITGMPPGHYGLNIHESADLSNSCANTRGHFNPHGHDHGHPDDEHRHVGDLGNIEFDKSRVAHVKITDRLIKLWGNQGIIGRSIVLSSRKDDHGKTEHPLSKVDGNTGDRVSCGVIGIK